MTDYFSHYCFAVPFNTEQTAWARRVLASVEDLYQSTVDGTDLDPQYDDIWEHQLYVAGGDATDPESPGFKIIEEGETVLISDDAGQSSLDSVPRLIHAVMRHFDMDGQIGFQWGETASRTVPGAFGGGAFLVSKDEIRSMSAHSWLEDGLQHSRIHAVNSILASWNFGAGSSIKNAVIVGRRLSEDIGEELSRDMRLEADDHQVIEAKFELEFYPGTSLVRQARIHADGANFGHSPLLELSASTTADIIPEP